MVFLPGDKWAGNRKGRPKDSISVITIVKQILKERAQLGSDDAGKQKLYLLAKNIVEMAIGGKDKDMIKLITNYIDGMPKQTLHTPDLSESLADLVHRLDKE